MLIYLSSINLESRVADVVLVGNFIACVQNSANQCKLALLLTALTLGVFAIA